MAYIQPACTCGGTSFVVLPGIQLHYQTATRGALTWTLTSVVCTTCTRTEMFTSNVDQIASHVPNARTISAGPQ